MEGKHRPIYIAREKKVKGKDSGAEGVRGGRRFESAEETETK